MTLEALFERIQQYVADTSRPAAETLEGLREARDLLDEWIEAIERDLVREAAQAAGGGDACC